MTSPRTGTPATTNRIVPRASSESPALTMATFTMSQNVLNACRIADASVVSDPPLGRTGRRSATDQWKRRDRMARFACRWGIVGNGQWSATAKTRQHALQHWQHAGRALCPNDEIPHRLQLLPAAAVGDVP